MNRNSENMSPAQHQGDIMKVIYQKDNKEAGIRDFFTLWLEKWKNVSIIINRARGRFNLGDGSEHSHKTSISFVLN